jgi:hypothetical protein
MKKLIPLLVVSIFVLSGLGAVAVPDEESIASMGNGHIEGEFKGGLGVGFTFTNNGSIPYEEQVNITIKIQRLINLKGKYYNFSMPTIPANETVSLRTPIIFGLGPVCVKYMIERPHGESKGTSIGLILGPFVLIGSSGLRWSYP